MEIVSEICCLLILIAHLSPSCREDKRDHAQLALNLVTATACPVAVPNYRLTPSANEDPQFRHPMHAEDILHFLQFVTGWQDPPCSFDNRSIFLIGHSCSAHMLSSILLDSSSVTPSLTPSQEVLDSVKGLILSEGIYDIDALLATFPTYRDWFIQATFGPSDSYAKYSVLGYTLRSPSSTSWLLLHSSGDTLVDIGQTDAMHKHLQELYPQGIFINTSDLKEEHNSIFRTDIYVKIVSDFIAKFV